MELGKNNHELSEQQELKQNHPEQMERNSKIDLQRGNALDKQDSMSGKKDVATGKDSLAEGNKKPDAKDGKTELLKQKKSIGLEKEEKHSEKEVSPKQLSQSEQRGKQLDEQNWKDNKLEKQAPSYSKEQVDNTIRDSSRFLEQGKEISYGSDSKESKVQERNFADINKNEVQPFLQQAKASVEGEMQKLMEERNKYVKESGISTDEMWNRSDPKYAELCEKMESLEKQSQKLDGLLSISESWDKQLESKPESADNQHKTVETKYDSKINDEVKDSLKAFEQGNWDSMDLRQRKEAVESLRDKVADDLELQNKPDIKYYNNPDETDLGGYYPSENSIYLNEYNMSDAIETADTVAYESRHCWQYERTENPQTEQDYAFKENFEDYIRPEDDYRGYKNQPIEKDARDYAKDITSNILTSENSSANTSDVLADNKSAEGIRENSQEKGAVFDKSTLPEDINSIKSSFESKVREPEQYNSKYDYDNQKKLEDYYKQGDGKLTDEQKTSLTNELKYSYDAVSKEERGNILVPENEKDVLCVFYNGNTQKYDVGYNWKDVDTVQETRKMKVMQAGDQFDRVGPPSGKCVGEVNSDGTCATRRQRSIPYHFTESDITSEPSYHRYEAEQDFTMENLTNAINNSFYSDAQKAEMHQKVEDYYERSHAKYGDGDGLAYGEIAPMFENTTGSTGGSYQYDMPLSMDELENIGMISEIQRDKY